MPKAIRKKYDKVGQGRTESIITNALMFTVPHKIHYMERVLKDLLGALKQM